MKKLLLFCLTSALLCHTSFAQTIAAGNSHSFFLCSTGSLKAWGMNYNGQLGNGSVISKKLPDDITGLSGVIAVSAATGHSLFLKSNGTVWACGYNSYGQLGDGTTQSKNTPVPVGITGSITAISTTGNHSLFLKSDGTVWACGYNFYGQLGDGTFQNRITPAPVGITNVIAISTGDYHSLFLKSDGTVWACGQNVFGQLGDGTKQNRYTPVQLTGITAISAGYYHSLFLKSDGSVWACGNNSDGQLGDGTFQNKKTPVQLTGITGITGITAISAGSYHSLFLKANGTVWACGSNSYGLLGDDIPQDRNTPIQITALTGSVTSIASRGLHSLFLKNDGTLWACGFNAYGQLGDGTNQDKKTPVLISAGCPVSQPPTVNFSNFPTSLCLGSNINIEPTVGGSNSGLLVNIDASINVTAPKTIKKNGHAVFVLDGNDQILRYGLNGAVQYTYNPSGATLSGIKAICVDENDNVYANNGNNIIYTFNTSAGSSSVQSSFLGNPAVAMLYGPNTYAPGNIMVADNFGNITGVNTNNANSFTNSQAYGDYTSVGGNTITSIALDNNSYAEKRMVAADPARHKLWAKKFYDRTGGGIENIKLLVDSNQTSGMALDFIDADTIHNIIVASSSTTKALAIITSFNGINGQSSHLDTILLTAAVNAQMPVGIVATTNGNAIQYWIADKTLNKIIRATPFVYTIIPALPIGLKFNPLTGKIDGSPTSISAPQTYTIQVTNQLGTNTSFFTFGVTPTASVSNTAGTSTATAVHNDGLTIKYYTPNNCAKIIEVADSIGNTFPGQSTITQNVLPTIAVFAADTFLRRVTTITAENQDSIKARIKLFYTYQDIKLFNITMGSTVLSNDTVGGTMQVAVLQMHDKHNGSKEIIKHSPVSATWSHADHNWAVNFPITKFSEFYTSAPSVVNSFICGNTGKDSIVINSSTYTWNYATFTVSGTYKDTLVNANGCDSIVTLKLTLNSTAGLTTKLLEKGLSIYPNPSSGILNIDIADVNVTVKRVTILNILGKEVFRKENLQSNSTIDLSSLPKGIYFVHINSEYETVTKKIIME